MVAGRLQEKKGYFYIVLSFKNKMGQYKTKWIRTGLPVKGNKKKAEAMLLEVRKNFEVQSSVVEEETTFARFMEVWLDMVKPSIELSTYAAYAYAVNVTICPYFKEKGLLLRDLQPRHIQDFYTYCLNERKVSASTVIHYHANIRKALKYAVDTDIIPTNPADKVQRPKKQKFIGKFYDIDEINELFRIVKGTRMELPVKLAAFYGMWRSDA